MVKYTRILFLCILTIGGSSCDTDDDDIIYDSIIGETWLGDLGFSDRYDYPLESGLYFEGNGLGHDDQVYYCLLYTSPSPRDSTSSRMPSSA